MKRILLPALLLLLSSFAFATPVGPMNYQGRLLDNNGIPVTGSYNFVVKIYDDPAAGTLKYQETKNGLAVDDGVYSFRIGTGPKTGGDSLWDIDLWQQNLNDLYLEVVVNGETLTPRHELTSSPHAFTATFALTTDSLGNVSADQVLQSICQSKRGVWLDIANKCLGYGTDFSVAAVGGAVVSIAALHSGTNFYKIDLSKADISGIDFGTASLHSGTFTQTIYNSNGVKAANLSYSTWDGATDINPSIVVFTSVIQGMTVKNMNISKWNLSGANAWPNYYLFSAAELSACPGNDTTTATYMAHNTWRCREQYTGSGRYMILGHALNMGAGSALAGVDGIMSSDRNIDNFNLQSTRFSGINIPVNFAGSWMNYAEFNGSTLVGTVFSDPAGMDYLQFNNAKLDGAVFSANSGVWTSWSLKKASLDNVVFNKGADQLTNFDFSGAYLNGVTFTNRVNNFNFTNAMLSNVTLEVEPASTATFSNTTFTGNMKVKLYKNGLGESGKVTFNNALFVNANITKNSFGGVACTDCGVEEAYFTNTRISNTTIDSVQRADFNNCTISQLHITSSAYQATFTNTPTSSIFFSAGARCPNGTYAATAGWGFNVCGM